MAIAVKTPLAILIVGVFTAIAVAGGPRHHLRDGWAFPGEQKPVLVFEALEPARRYVVLALRPGLIPLWSSGKPFPHFVVLPVRIQWALPMNSDECRWKSLQAVPLHGRSTAALTDFFTSSGPLKRFRFKCCHLKLMRGCIFFHPGDEDLSITPGSKDRSLGAPIVAGDPGEKNAPWRLRFFKEQNRNRCSDPIHPLREAEASRSLRKGKTGFLRNRKRDRMSVRPL